jgi:hypothetical protein
MIPLIGESDFMARGAMSAGDGQICKMLRSHFSTLRQRQKQSTDSFWKATEDLRFTLKFVNDSVTHPVSMLQEMGIINLRRSIAFNFDLLQLSLVIPRARFVVALHREGWKDTNDEASQRALAQLVGPGETKQWLLMCYPEDSEIAREIMENPRLTATETNLSTEAQIKASARRVVEHSTEVPFPLVAVQYERDLADFEVADFCPVDIKPKFSFIHCESFNLRGPG